MIHVFQVCGDQPTRKLGLHTPGVIINFIGVVSLHTCVFRKSDQHSCDGRKLREHKGSTFLAHINHTESIASLYHVVAIVGTSIPQVAGELSCQDE